MKKITFVLIIVATFFVTSTIGAYTIKKGDTLTKLAKFHHLTLDEIAIANPQIHDLDFIYIGQVVNLSKPQTKTDQKNHNSTIEDQATVQVDENKSLLNEFRSPKVGMGGSTSEEEIELLARLVRSEANTEPFEGKVAVAEVGESSKKHPIS